MSVDFVCMNVCLKQQQTGTVRGKGKLQWEWMQYVNSGVSLIRQDLRAYSASQFTTTSPHKTTSMAAPPLLPTLFYFSAPGLSLAPWMHTLIHLFAGFEGPQKTTAVNELLRPIKQAKAIKRYFSGVYYLVWERQVKLERCRCLQTTSQCSCRSREPTSSCGSHVSRGPLLLVLSPFISVCMRFMH